MRVNPIYLDLAGNDGALPGGAAPAAAVAAPATPAAGSNDGAGAKAADGAPGGATAQAGSLLARGAGSAPAGPGTEAAPAADGAQPASIPDKYLVKREDGSTDWEASALKQAQGYDSLAKRMGSGDAPPKTAADYAPELPQGMSLDTLKADPMYQGFLKGAHGRGMTNAQVSYVLDAMAQRMAPNPEAAEAELRQVWKTDEQLQAGLAGAFRVVKAYAGDEATMQRLEQKFGSDPDFIKFVAKIAPEMGEDRAAPGLTAGEADTMESLMTSPAYLDAKAPDHARVVAQVRSLYAKKYAGK
jgi:hypothetical protein